MNHRFVTWVLYLCMIIGAVSVLLGFLWPLGLTLFMVSLIFVVARGHRNTPNRNTDHTPWV